MKSAHKGVEKSRKGVEKSILDGLELGLERYIAGVFENCVLDETPERLANGIRLAVKAYHEAGQPGGGGPRRGPRRG